MPTGASAGTTESPFEREVMLALVARGLTVVPQVGVAGYRIDLGVTDPDAPGRFVCGIECDGVAYHSSETARDRDRLRQQVLEARGWTLLRVWSTDWFKDRAGQIDRIVRLVEEARSACARGSRSHGSAPTRWTASLPPTAAASPRRRRWPSRRIDGAVDRLVAAPYVFAGARVVMRAGSCSASRPGRWRRRSAPSSRSSRRCTWMTSTTRVAAMWDTRAGTRIQSRIVDACALAERQHLIERRGEFLWNPGHDVVVRSRAGTRIPAERIAPEEYRSAVMAVLDGNRAFARPALVNEVRSLLGFARTGPSLEEAISTTVAAMLADGVLGEGSTGVRRR